MVTKLVPSPAPLEKGHEPKGANVEILRSHFQITWDAKVNGALLATCMKHPECKSWRIWPDVTGDIRKGDKKALLQHAEKMEVLP
jgi:hypothetical protein